MMRRSIVSGITLSILVAAPALAQDKGAYVGAEGGFNIVTDRDFDNGSNGIALSSDQGGGFAAGAVLGYDFGKWRMEVEGVRRGNGIDSLDFTNGGGLGLIGEVGNASGRLNSTAALANVIYELGGNDEWTPYLGAGVGVASVKLDSVAGFGTAIADSEDTAIALQAMAGIEKMITDSVAVSAAYKYFRTVDGRFAFADGATADMNYGAHSILFSLLYKFGKKAPPPPPPPPLPPANVAPTAADDSATVQAGQSVTICVLRNDGDADGDRLGVQSSTEPQNGTLIPQGGGCFDYTPDQGFDGRDGFTYVVTDGRGGTATASVTIDVTPMPVPGPFIVFFDFDEAIITDQAQAILRDAAEAFRTYGRARIEATGHTDTSGPAWYNNRLALQRVENVRAELVRLGIPADRIDIFGRGESEPLLATGDDVREPQNRRVEIEFFEREGDRTN